MGVLRRLIGFEHVSFQTTRCQFQESSLIRWFSTSTFGTVTKCDDSGVLLELIVRLKWRGQVRRNLADDAYSE